MNELETTAQARYPADWARHPSLAIARLAVDFEAEARETRARSQEGRIWRAAMLAPTLETCEALLNGGRVPLDRLDPVWVRRLGLK